MRQLDRMATGSMSPTLCQGWSQGQAMTGGGGGRMDLLRFKQKTPISRKVCPQNGTPNLNQDPRFPCPFVCWPGSHVGTHKSLNVLAALVPKEKGNNTSWRCVLFSQSFHLSHLLSRTNPEQLRSCESGLRSPDMAANDKQTNP